MRSSRSCSSLQENPRALLSTSGTASSCGAANRGGTPMANRLSRASQGSLSVHPDEVRYGVSLRYVPETRREVKRVPLRAGFAVPSQDLHRILETLGCKLFSRDRTLVQHIAWSMETGLLALLHEAGSATVDE